MHDGNVDWINVYANYTKSKGLKGIDRTDLSLFRKQMVQSWSRLAQKRGFEVAVKSLHDPKLFEILLPELSSWDELVDRLDKRVCSENINLGTAIKWFSIVQAILCVVFLFPFLWPVITKYFMFRTIRKGSNRFLYINRWPELGGELPAMSEDEPHASIDKHQSEEQNHEVVTSYMVFHVRSDTVDWLPDNIKSKVKKESKAVRASKELFDAFCQKLRKYEDEYQATMRRHLQESAQERMHLMDRESETPFDRLRDWLARTIGSRNRSSDKKKIEQRGRVGKNLRRTYSAIPAQEYEKEELINLHLLPASRQPSTSNVKGTTSLLNIR